MPTIEIRHFTDPGCPSPSRPSRGYGGSSGSSGSRSSGASTWSCSPSAPRSTSRRGSRPRCSRRAGRSSAQGGACRSTARCPRGRPRRSTRAEAIVATRLRAPEREAAITRRLRVLGMAGELIDEPAVLARAAAEAGLDADALAAWLEADDVAETLAEDRRAARSPAPGPRWRSITSSEARRTSVATPARRSSCRPASRSSPPPASSPRRPTRRRSPTLRRTWPGGRTRARSRRVLEWAPFPLATVEVAAVCARDRGRGAQRARPQRLGLHPDRGRRLLVRGSLSAPRRGRGCDPVADLGNPGQRPFRRGIGAHVRGKRPPTPWRCSTMCRRAPT
jgi:hypothetical protein